VLLGGAQDHKRAYDGDLGPNTGGMGSYSPAPVFTPELVEAAERDVVAPVIAGMAAEGMPYRGVLYAGLMSTTEGPKVVEFNARFGDPECQVLMMRLAGDIVPVLLACARGDLSRTPPPEFLDETVICVVMAAQGYPDSPVEGSIIRGAEQDFGPHVQVFHAGTRRQEDGQLAAGGKDIAEARQRAYAAVKKRDWPGGFNRTDIGWRALERE
jgi:phosphoribosylamine--glycine ligase